MFRLSLIMISYASLVLLLMPATGAGAAAAAVVFAAGIALILYKRVYKITFVKERECFFGLLMFFTAVYLGLVFYNRWISFSKSFAIENMLLISTVMLPILSVPFLYIGIRIIKNHIAVNRKRNFAVNLLSALITSAVTVGFAQIMIDVPVLAMGEENFMWGVLIVAVTILLLYCLLGKIVPSIFIGSGIFMVISTINVYVYKFRVRLLEPLDIFSAGTAMNVLDNYSLFPISTSVLICWGLFLVLVTVLFCFQHRTESELTVMKRCVLLSFCIAGSVAICSYISDLETYHWKIEGAENNGYILDFASKFKELSVPKPDNYSTDLIAQLADKYTAESNAADSQPSEYPHIIVIMDEGFADLRVVGEFETNIEVTPFISSLKENAVSGYTLVSVVGGNTANSEYEFLTGNSMAWLSPNTVPYQQYIRSSTYSMVSYLKSAYNYKCVAMHPFHATGWNRPVAYGHLGFDETYFLEDFPREKIVRRYVSDQEMVEFMIEKFEAEKDTPLFLFGVTMQNHGSFGSATEGPTYTKHVTLPEYVDKYPEAEEYLSVIHETDKAVEYLIHYFQNTDEDVVIVFFGDHQPSIEESFYRKIKGKEPETLDTIQNRYKVPFFVWANYDIEEEYIDCVSLNYLSSYVYNVAGIPLSPYNRFLQEMESIIPAINANNFYSIDSGRFVHFGDGNEEEKQWLELYEILQYNNIFDKKHRNEILFPVLN